MITFALGTTKNVAHNERKLIRSVAFKLSASAMAPPSPISFWWMYISVMVLFTLCYSQPVLARAWLYACFAERLRSFAVCGRHTWTSARKRQLRVRLFFLLLLWRCLCHAVRVKRCATRPWHGIPGAVYLHACRVRGHVLRCRGVSRCPSQKPEPHQGYRCHDHVDPGTDPECGSCLTWCACVYLCFSSIIKVKNN